MDDNRRQVLTAELEDAKRELQRLTLYVETLSDRLGLSTSDGNLTREDQAAQPAARGDSLPVTDDPSSLVYPNEFVGMSLPKAAEAALTRFSPPPNRRPLKTVDLTAALRKGGLQVTNPSQLYRSLHKHSRFHSLGRGMWGLAEWYPAAVRHKAAKDASSQVDAQDASVSDLPSQPQEGDVEPEEVASSGEFDGRLVWLRQQPARGPLKEGGQERRLPALSPGPLPLAKSVYCRQRAAPSP